MSVSCQPAIQTSGTTYGVRVITASEKGTGFSPAITEMFGFGQTVHSSIGRLHQEAGDAAPTPEQASQLARENFHLKHVRAEQGPRESSGRI